MSKNNRNSLTCIPIRRQVKYSKKALTKVYSARRIDELNKHLFYFCRDNNILNLDTRKSKMIVVKEADGFFKGEKVVDREKIKAIQDSGGRYRNITFLKSHETQWFAKNISALIDVSMPNQHGFTAERGIYTAAKQILDDACQREITQAVNIDLENAFNAIPKQAVFLIFRDIFDLNKQYAQKLADMACDGSDHLFQGCPFAPQIYNIWVIGILHSIEKLGFKVAAYADDLTIYGSNNINWKVVATINKRVKFWNMKINKKKVRFFKVKKNDNLDTVGLKISKDSGFAEPLSFRKQLRKLKYFLHLFHDLDKRSTHRMSKLGEPIQLIHMINGLHNWLDESFRRYPRKRRQLHEQLILKVWSAQRISREEFRMGRLYEKMLTDFSVWKNQIDNNSITQIQRKIQFPTQNFREVIRFHLGELPGWKGAFGNHAGVYEKFIATNDKIMNIFL